MTTKTTPLVDQAIAYIAKHPGARSPAIAEALGTSPGNISAMLMTPTSTGYLVACKVSAPGRPPMNEYRLSATVADSGQSWGEFKSANRHRPAALAASPERPPRTAAPARSTVATKAPAPETLAPKTTVPTPATEAVKAPQPLPAATETAARISPPEPSQTPERIVFALGTDGRLRIEIPGHPPIICSDGETRALGDLIIAAEPIWS